MGNNNEKENNDFNFDLEIEPYFNNDIFNLDLNHLNNQNDNLIEEEIVYYPIRATRYKKYSFDNIRTKINKFFFNIYIIDLIIKNSIKNNISLKILSINFIYKLNNKQNIERLLDMKISDIFIEQEISSNIANYLKDYNKKIIDKIYEEKKEIKVIKILELTFEELFIIFRRKLNLPLDSKKLEKKKDKIEVLDLLEENNNYKDVEYLIQKIKSKDKYDSDYIEKFIRACYDYNERT